MKWIGYEFKKIGIFRYSIVLVACIIFANIIIGVLYDDKKMREKEGLIEERTFYEEGLSTASSDDVEMREICEKEIAIIDYAIENNIAYHSLSIFSNFTKNKIFENMYLTIVVLAMLSLMSVEYSSATFKNLIVGSKGRYGKILCTKKCAQYLIILCAMLLCSGLIAAYGVIAYGRFDNVMLSYVAGDVVESSYNHMIINQLVGFLVRCIVYGNIAFLISVLAKDSKWISAVLVGLIVFENTILGFVSKFKFSVLLPYRYIDVLKNVMNHQADEIIKSAIYIMVMLVLMDAIIVRLLKRNKAG